VARAISSPASAHSLDRASEFVFDAAAAALAEAEESLIQSVGKQPIGCAAGDRAPRRGWRLTASIPKGSICAARAPSPGSSFRLPSPRRRADGDGRRPAAGGDGAPKKVTVR